MYKLSALSIVSAPGADHCDVLNGPSTSCPFNWLGFVRKVKSVVVNVVVVAMIGIFQIPFNAVAAAYK